MLDHLPERDRDTVKRRLRQGWQETDHDIALEQLTALALELDRPHPGAAASLREGMEETLTVIRLGVTAKLQRTLQSTNPCESMISTVRTTQRNVKNWSSGEMCLRWTAAGMLEAEKQFRKVIGYTPLPQLAIASAIERRLHPHQPTLSQEATIPVTMQPSHPDRRHQVPRRPGQPRVPSGIALRAPASRALDGADLFSAIVAAAVHPDQTDRADAVHGTMGDPHPRRATGARCTFTCRKDRAAFARSAVSGSGREECSSAESERTSRSPDGDLSHQLRRTGGCYVYRLRQRRILRAGGRGSREKGGAPLGRAGRLPAAAAVVGAKRRGGGASVPHTLILDICCLFYSSCPGGRKGKTDRRRASVFTAARTDGTKRLGGAAVASALIGGVQRRTVLLIRGRDDQLESRPDGPPVVALIVGGWLGCLARGQERV